MIKVYIAGKYNSDNVIDVLKNIRKGIKMGAKLLKLGFAPFCPFLDFQFGFHEDISIDNYKAFSIEWLRACDCVLMLDNWTRSEGAKEEMRIAYRMGLLVFNSLDELLFWYCHEKGNA